MRFYKFVSRSVNQLNTLVFTVAARAFFGASQLALETATVFLNAAIVLTRATKAFFFHFNLKRIRALV